MVAFVVRIDQMSGKLYLERELMWKIVHFTKQACRENAVASFFPLKIFIPLCFNVLSTVPRENRLADSLYIYIYIYVYTILCIYNKVRI